jgi:hypothetical protein
MSYFVKSTEHDMNMHAKFEDLILHGFLELIPSIFYFLELSIEQ